MKKVYTLLVVMLFLSVSAIRAQITGDTAVCAGETVIYHAPVITGATYSWSPGGGIISGSGTLDSVVIHWSAAGTGTLIVTINNPNNTITYYTLNVSIHPRPHPVITNTPYASCPVDTDRQGGTGPQHGAVCQKVCKGATISYSTPQHGLNTYQWVINGASVVSGVNTNIIIVTWDTTAYGNIVVYETNQWGCIDSAILCIEKLPLPKALFSSQTSVCKFSNVFFTNLSTGASSYQWTFGDGGVSTIFSPTHAYAAAGTYTITLIALTDCRCADTFSRLIYVDSLSGPAITCPSTLCPNQPATYTAAASPGCVYNWLITGGAIISGQLTPTINVQWGPGQIGSLGLFITGCNAVCTDTSWVYIPIVATAGTISGPAKVCAGDCEYYSLPLFSGATYKWKLHGACGVLQDSTCCEKVRICWASYLFQCNDTLTVTYFDSILGCGGSASMIIRLRPKLQIQGDALVCANAVSNYTSFGGVPCNWYVTPATPFLSPANPTSTLNINWNNILGTYVIKALPVNPNSVCNDSAEYNVNVVIPPPAPLFTGDTVVCPGSSVSYCATGNVLLNWIITGGTPSTGIGNCITVNWNNTGPYIVQAYEVTTTSPFCHSDTTAQNVHPAIIGPPVMTGTLTACANGTYTYGTTTVYPPGTTYTWGINLPNAGAILSPGSSSTQIESGNNAPQNVTVTLSVSVCGMITQNTLIVALTPIPTPTVNQLGSLCAGGTAQLQAVGGAYTSYIWSGPGAYTSALNPTTITQSGLYQVTVTDVSSCTALSQKNVTYVSGPTASISTSDYLIHCIGTTYTVNLCALGNVNYTYTWSNLAVSQCTSASGPGSYVVTVTDVSNGCTALSNVLVVVEDSCNVVPGVCTPLGSISFTHTQCNPMTFTNTSVNGSNYSWNFGDLSGSILASPTHTYAQAGFYLVTLMGNVPNGAGGPPCVLRDTAHIEIPLSAKFDVVVGCDGDPVCFTDRSTFTAGNNITSWSWAFGDANTSTAQSPCHTYAAQGSYNVTLTVSNGICAEVYTMTIVVPASPTAAFTFTNPNCINTPAGFFDASFTSINYWNWSFGDLGTSLNQNPSHTYVSASTYPVTLIVHNTFGCRDTVQQNILVSSPSLTGNISAYPDTVVCAGTPVLLVAPACLTCTYLWNTGSTNDSITITTTGIYTVTMTDANGCPYTTFIRIVVNNGPPAVIVNNGSDDLCISQSTSLQVPLNSNWTYYWISNDGINNGNMTNLIYVFGAVPGIYTYQVVITDTSTGCYDTSLVYIVQVHALPVTPTITAAGPSVVCAGDTITLVGFHPDITTIHQWNTGDISDTLLVIMNGCYQCKVTDTFGCQNKTSFCATVNPLPDLCAFYVGCFDTCSPYTILGPPNGATYQWLLNGGIISGANQQNYTANVSGSYQVIVSNVYGCTDTTGILNLNLYMCDSLCAHLDIDSMHCDSVGHQVIYYHVVNNSGMPLTQVNFEILQPNLNIAYAPNVNFVSIPSGTTSPQLSATIYNAIPGQVLCFRAHVAEHDSMGHEMLCCYSDTDCITVPPCHEDTNCCYFRFVSDSVTSCQQTPVGTQYNFTLKLYGCGTLTIQTPNNGVLNVSNPYVLVPGLNTITGSYISSTDSILCLTYVVSHNGSFCADTTICFHINCDQQPLPCRWDYNRQVCAGNNTPFGYYGNNIGVTVTWSFPGGVPSTAVGPGPHSINYPTPGVYPFSMTLTNVNGSHTCTDSITVIAAPVASITQSGNTLNAFPAGMSYQWYNGPNLAAINGATNQFYNPPVAGIYCVMVSNNSGCYDSACKMFTYSEGIMELSGSSWNIYPNPNDGSFTLSIDVSKTGPAQMEIVNTLGEIVDQREFDLNTGIHQFYISNKGISAGIYSVQIKTQSGIGVKRMIVKQ